MSTVNPSSPVPAETKTQTTQPLSTSSSKQTIGIPEAYIQQRIAQVRTAALSRDVESQPIPKSKEEENLYIAFGIRYN